MLSNKLHRPLSNEQGTRLSVQCSVDHTVSTQEARSSSSCRESHSRRFIQGLCSWPGVDSGQYTVVDADSMFALDASGTIVPDEALTNAGIAGRPVGDVMARAAAARR